MSGMNPDAGPDSAPENTSPAEPAAQRRRPPLQRHPACPGAACSDSSEPEPPASSSAERPVLRWEPLRHRHRRRAPPSTPSTAPARPASRRRRRTACTSPPTTWRAGADRSDLIELLQDWTYAAARMTQGLEVTDGGAVGGSPLAPPADTGEALGLPAAGLTITFGFGPTLFSTDDGEDRFGIAAKRPELLTRLPRFSGDSLRPELGGGDLCIQACADDPQVAVHAIRNLSRIAFGRASIRWSQLGFGRTSSTSTSQVTPRNLFGFKDGTANVKAEDTKLVDDQVFVGSGDSPAWLAGGSYLVTRKIRMIIETWDRTRLEEQQRVIGRDKGEGAPLSGGTEFTAPDFEAQTAAGTPAIDR